MPTVGVFEDSLHEALGEKLTEKEFDELCFQFGLELDEVTSDFEMVKKERGAEAAQGMSTRTIYKVDVPANRYDLLCVEGLTRALQIFKGKMKIPDYKLNPKTPNPDLRMMVAKEVTQIRPFVVCAILRNVTFTPDRYQSFIDLQDKLHQNICRRRTLVAIGTHDLDTIKGPFTYEALPPEKFEFVPLKETEKMNGKRLMEFYSTHQQLKAYLPIIRDSPVYPVIFDANRVVLSCPPIINGDHSKITLDTKNVFIEMTATDLTKATITLNTVVAMFSEHCSTPFEVEPVMVEYPKDYASNTFVKAGDKIVYPKLEGFEMKADINRMKRQLALEKLSSEEVRDYFQRMSIPCQVDSKDKGVLNVHVPITRSDVMHECDLVEDLAIAYGYNNLTQEVPQTLHWPSEQPVNHLTDLLRSEVAMAGFNECLNWGLVSMKEAFGNLRREPKKDAQATEHEYNPFALPVRLSNPKSKDFEVVRTSLLSGLLKTMYANKHNPPPVKLFEISDVVIQDTTRETGCRNQRRIAAVFMGMKTGFEVVHGLLDQILWKLNCEPVFQHKNKKKKAYSLAPSNDPAFFDGRQAHVQVEGVNIGIVGVLHPEVLPAFGLELPASALEINIEAFLQML